MSDNPLNSNNLYEVNEDDVKESLFLTNIWKKLNIDAFDGRINGPCFVFWEQMQGGTLGKYWYKMNAICISNKFEFLEKKTSFIQKHDNDISEKEFDDWFKKYSIVLGILVHEMVHQIVFQVNGRPSQDHGEEFVDQANIVQPLDSDKPWPLCTVENAPTWPVFIKID